jgi:hypothetical protein
MTMVAGVEKVLHHGTSILLSGVRQDRTTGQILPMTAQKLRQQMACLTTTSRMRHLPVVLIAIAVGATMVVVASVVAVSRFLLAQQKEKVTAQ